ncbi:hypothetical protein ACTFIU_009640 [Dictyostelium citrinum]
MKNNNNNKYKIVLFGDYWDFNNDKKSFRRFGDDDDDVVVKTENRIKNIEFRDTGEEFKLFIYDVNEYSESYIYCKSFYFKGVDGYILVYNPLNNYLNNSSFENVKNWLIEIKKHQFNNNNWKDWFNIYSWLNWFNNNNTTTITKKTPIIIVLDKTHLKDNDSEYEKIKFLANNESIQLIEITNSKESTNKMYFQLTKLIFDSK